MDDIEKDAYIIELEKCKLIRLCIIDKINKKCSQKPLCEYVLSEEKHLNDIVNDTDSKYTYLQLVEELKKLL